MTRSPTQRQELEKEYHNSRYGPGEPYRNHNNVQRSYAYFQEQLERIGPKDVLDFGCGDGWLSSRMARAGGRVRGIDISEVLIARARRRHPAEAGAGTLEFFVMSGEDLSFAGNSFDYVIGSAILHHVDLAASLAGIHRTLRSGGRALFIEPMNVNVLLRLWRKMTPWRRSPAERALTREDLGLIREKFPLATFRFFCLSAMATSGLLLLFPGSRPLSWANTVLEKFDGALLRAFPVLGRYCAVVVIEAAKS